MDANTKKIEVLREMLLVTMVDNAIYKSDYNFLKTLCMRLGLSKNKLDNLLYEENIFIVRSSAIKAVIEFYEYVLRKRSKVNGNYDGIKKLYDKGLLLGLPGCSTKRFLYDVFKYPEKVVHESDVLRYFNMM